MAKFGDWTELAIELSLEPEDIFGDSYMCTVGIHVVALRYCKYVVRGKEINLLKSLINKKQKPVETYRLVLYSKIGIP